MNKDRLKLFKSKFGVAVFDSPKEAVKGADLVLFAVKPQNMEKVFSQLRGHASPDATLLSIVAGVPIAEFQGKMGNENICRSMPNTVNELIDSRPKEGDERAD